MKKNFFLLVGMLCACVGLHAASYGMLINGKTYYAGSKNNSPQDPSFEEYAVLGVPVEAGDQLQLYDKDNAAAWAVTLDSYSVSGFTLNGDHYECSISGCYDFYIKLKWQADQLYIGASSGDCSGNTGENIGEEDESTGLGEVVENTTAAQKRIENNMLLIQRGEQVYTITGQCVK